MKILHLSESDHSSGAGKAAFRLHKCLTEIGVDARMIVGSSKNECLSVAQAGAGRGYKAKSLLCAYLDSLMPRFYTKRTGTTFSAGAFGYMNNLGKRVEDFDLVTLFWIAGGFLTPQKIAQIKKPIVWRLSDMWPFTGGCHYAYACDGYEKKCGTCPVLKSSSFDLSRLGLYMKKKSFSNLDMTIVCPSQWLAKKASKSAVFEGRDIRTIHTGIDHSIFRPHDKIKARQLLDLPMDKKIILFGALGAISDTRKGYDLAINIIENLAEKRKDICLVVFGDENSQSQKMPLETIYMGRIKDERLMSLIFSAGDVLIAPYREDNLPNVLLEAFACGLPAVGFNVGGIPEIIDDGINGYVAAPFDVSSFAVAVEKCLDQNQEKKLSMAAIDKAKKCFSLTEQAQSYKKLYEEIYEKKMRHEKDTA